MDGTEMDGTEMDGTEMDGTEMDGTEMDGTEMDGTEMYLRRTFRICLLRPYTSISRDTIQIIFYNMI